MGARFADVEACPSCWGCDGEDDLVVARFDANGDPDSSWGGTGEVITNVGSTDFPLAIASQPDGKVVVAMVANATIAVLRFDSLGVLDPSFAGIGRVSTSLVAPDKFGRFGGLVVQPDGKILVGGRIGNGFALAR